MTLLACRDLTVQFGGVAALTEAEFSVEPGTIGAVIGPNGAGKTTLFNAITGFVKPKRGTVILDGVDLSVMAPFERSRAGLARTFQNLEVFGDATVLENVLVGRHAHLTYSGFAALFRTPAWRKGERAAREAALDRLDFVGLADLADHRAGDMPYGHQRRLEIARALASDPKLILLDEPAAGLNMKETAELAERILAIRDGLGIAVAVVEHDMDLVMGISDRVTVFQFGRFLASGTPAEIRANPAVLAAYLGDEDDEPAPKLPKSEDFG